MSTSAVLARFQGFAETRRVAVHDGAGSHTYAGLEAGAQRIAAALLGGRDSLAGARVALLVSPGAPFVEAFYGVLLAGGCVVVLSPLHPEAESRYMLEDAGAVAVLTDTSLRDRVPEVAGAPVFLVTELGDGDRPSSPVLPVVAADAPALQLYTSGTTGRPKGAVLTHSNLGVQQELLAAAWGLSAEDVLLHALPLHHMHGLVIALLSCLGAGGAALMLPSFDAGAVWESMARTTVLMAVPTMYAKLFTAFEAADERTRARWTSLARSLRLATSGSAALPVGLAERWRSLTGEIPLERFGMTELGVALSNPLSGERRPGTVGNPLPSVRVRITGEDGEDADTGELWVAGPSLFAGYHGRPEANEAAFVQRGDTRWFRTGDTVTYDEAGYVRILGRTSVDILKSGGYKLSALEIEEALRKHPGIAEVAVVGVPDETWGDRVVACVVPHAGHEASCREDALRAFAKEHLAPYKVPRDVVAFGELPRNALGKVLKPELARTVAARLPKR